MLSPRCPDVAACNQQDRSLSSWADFLCCRFERRPADSHVFSYRRTPIGIRPGMMKIGSTSPKQRITSALAQRAVNCRPFRRQLPTRRPSCVASASIFGAFKGKEEALIDNSEVLKRPLKEELQPEDIRNVFNYSNELRKRYLLHRFLDLRQQENIILHGSDRKFAPAGMTSARLLGQVALG